MMEKKGKHFQRGKNAKKSENKSNNPEDGGKVKSAFKKPMRNGLREDEEIKALLSKYATIDTKKVQSFKDLPLSRKTLLGLQKCKFNKPTEIQQHSIGYALQGRDVLGAAITG